MKYPILLLFVLMSSFIYSQSNYMTFSEVKQKAIEEDKPILLVFSGSDWCKPCVKLKKDVIDTPSFKDKASSEFVFLYLDFPYKRANRLPKDQLKHNEELAEKYNPKGQFPHIVLLNNNADQTHEIAYKPGTEVSEFLSILNNKILQL